MRLSRGGITATPPAETTSSLNASELSALSPMTYLDEYPLINAGACVISLRFPDVKIHNAKQGKAHTCWNAHFREAAASRRFTKHKRQPTQHRSSRLLPFVGVAGCRVRQDTPPREKRGVPCSSVQSQWADSNNQKKD